MYETGTYFKKDPKRAVEYYKRAAALGDKDADLRILDAPAASMNSPRYRTENARSAAMV